MFKRRREIDAVVDIVLGEDKRYRDISLGRNSCRGLKERVSKLEAKNDKLKAIVAELCDYVYRENK